MNGWQRRGPTPRSGAPGSPIRKVCGGAVSSSKSTMAPTARLGAASKFLARSHHTPMSIVDAKGTRHSAHLHGLATRRAGGAQFRNVFKNKGRVCLCVEVQKGSLIVKLSLGNKDSRRATNQKVNHHQKVNNNQIKTKVDDACLEGPRREMKLQRSKVDCS